MLNSWIDAAKILNFEFRISSPKEYSVDNEVIDGFANIILNPNPDEASANSNCLLTHTCFSMAEEHEDKKHIKLRSARSLKSCFIIFVIIAGLVQFVSDLFH